MPTYELLVAGVALFFRRCLADYKPGTKFSDVKDDIIMDLIDVTNDWVEELIEDAIKELDAKTPTVWLVQRKDNGEWLGKGYPVWTDWSKNNPRIFTALHHIKQTVNDMSASDMKERFKGLEIEAREFQLLSTSKVIQHDDLMGGAT